MPLHILVDENIPLASEAFSTLGRVTCLPGRRMTPEAVRIADVLLVRSVTRVDAALLEGSAVRFVGSATIGTDHVDRAYVQERGIAFAYAPGSNAESVVEYVLAALLRLSVRKAEALRGKTVGIVGCGHIGGQLAVRLPAFGVRVLKNDPPLAEHARQAERPHDFVPLDKVLAEADILTSHVPLTREGPHATYHLLDETTLRRMKPGAWLLNTARGAVVSNEALKAVLADGHLGAAVLDVWENEPVPDPGLLHLVDLATPHIAGYSFDGKIRGTRMLYQALVDYLDVLPTWDAGAALAPGPDEVLPLAVPDPMLSEMVWLDHLVRQMYDLQADDARLRRLLTLPPEKHAAYFSGLRKQYPRRRSFTRHTQAHRDIPDRYRTLIEEGLRIQRGQG
ncbi:MAG: 4-phosphoerythronate dehydrogenase [Rhodothermales bacterium]